MPWYMNLLRALHLVGMLLLYGGVITFFFWNRRAVGQRRTGETISFVHSSMVSCERWFVIPGGVLLGISGSLLYRLAEPSPSLGFLLPKLAVFAVVTQIWLHALIPSERAMGEMGRQAGQSRTMPPRFNLVRRRWIFWGILNYGLMLLILLWSVLAPR